MGPTNVRWPLRSRKCRCVGGDQAEQYNSHEILAYWRGYRASSRCGTGGIGGNLMDEALEEALGIHFQNPELLHLALTNRSYIYETAGGGLTSNERLASLGDSILPFFNAAFLCHGFPGFIRVEFRDIRATLLKK